MKEHVISDLSIAVPSSAISTAPARDRWIVIPYDGEISGKMLWAPMRSQPPDISIPLPALGLCKIYVGIYGSGEAPVWIHVHYGRQRGAKHWNRLYLKLSDEDWFDFIVPDEFSREPAFHYISESLWKTADVTGKRLVLAPPRKEAFVDTTACLAYLRLVPVKEEEIWPRATKRLICYYDGNFMGHFVSSAADVKTEIAPLTASDCEIVLWNTCREDTCFYPTKIGHVLPWHETPGAYPHWMGRDLQQMLLRGENPLKTACDVAHACGMKIFGSYRRLTCRLAPHVFPLHPEAMLMKRRDLWCKLPDGDPAPHLSLAYSEVRQRMLDLFIEQAENYDIDGVHMFFCRGVPLVLFEQPFVDAFQEKYGVDPRPLALGDRRVWEIRAIFFMKYLRDLRSALNAVGKKRGRRFEIAITVMNSPDVCAYFGMDIQKMVAESLVDILVPFPCHYLPDEMGEWRLMPEMVAEFVRITKGSGIRIYPDCGYDYSGGTMSVEKRAAAFYDAGADGLQVNQYGVRGFGRRGEDAVHRRLGHIKELCQAETWQTQACRAVRVKKIAGFRLDRLYGLHTCG